MRTNHIPHRLGFSIITILFMAFLASCSGGSSVAPDATGNDPAYDFDTFPILATSELNGPGSNAYGILGAYEIDIDVKNLTGEVTGLRSNTGIGDFFIVDITDFLLISPCVDCLIIDEINIDEDGYVVVTFGLKHPYDLPQPHFPEYLNRKDLHVFDVQGVVFMNPPDGSETTRIREFPATRSDIDGKPHTSDKTIKIDSGGFLVDAYGYNTTLDEVIDDIYPTDFNTHPFKMFFEYPFEGNFDPNSTTTGFLSVNSARGYNVMGMGSSMDYVDYTLNIGPGETFSFLMVISASYGQSAKGQGTNLGERLWPRYFCPQFNRKEAWRVYVTVENNELLPQSPTSTADIVVYVRDWQESDGHLVSSSSFDPMTSRAGDYTAVSGVREVSVDIPGFKLGYDKDATGGSLDPPYEDYLFIWTTPESGDGSESNPLKYRIQVQNENGAGLGTYNGLVAVRDELEGAPLSIGVERDGISIFPISDFTTYMPFTIDISMTQNPFNPTQQIITHTDSIMSNIRFDRANVAQDGNNIFLVYRGRVGTDESIWSQRSGDNGVTWGVPQQISIHADDINDAVKTIACDVNADGNPICAWIDGSSNVIYKMGTKSGSNEVNWTLTRVDTNYDNPSLSPDIAIAGDAGNSNHIVISTNYSTRNKACLYSSTNARIDWLGDTATFSEVLVDYYYSLYPRPYVDVMIGDDGVEHIVYQINWGTRYYLLYTNTDTSNQFPYYFCYIVNSNFLGTANWPKMALTSHNEPVIVWEDTGSFSIAGSDIAIAMKKDGAKSFTKPIVVNNDDFPIANQFKPDIVINPESDNAWVIYEDKRHPYTQVFMTVMNVHGETVLIDDYQINTDTPPYDHEHRIPQFTMYAIPGYFPHVHGFWLDYGGPNNPFIGHNNT
ncbi:hypothetical protein J7L05_10450 [bacterium]|nr:hypothetical protein [bacterium]